MRSSCSRGGSTRPPRSATPSSCSVVPLLEQDRLDEAESAFKAGEQAYDQLSLRKSSRVRVGRPGRPGRAAAWRRPHGGQALPPGRRRSARRPLLIDAPKGGDLVSKARLIYFAIFAILIATALSACTDALSGRKGRTTARRSRVTACVSCVAVLALAALTAGCGSGPVFGARRAHRGRSNHSGRSRRRRSGLSFLRTNDYSPGDLRISFLGEWQNRREARCSADGALLDRPVSVCEAAPGDRYAPGADRSARRRSGADARIYVAHFHVTAPGKYYVLARRTGRSRSAGSETSSSRSGRRRRRWARSAYPSATPTLAERHAARSQSSRRASARPGALRYSIADSLAAHAQFVVTFTTPRFCTSRTCGPVSTSSTPCAGSSRNRHPLHPRRDLRGQRPA